MNVTKFNESFYFCENLTEKEARLISDRLKVKKDKSIYIESKMSERDVKMFNSYNNSSYRKFYRYYEDKNNKGVIIPLGSICYIPELIQEPQLQESYINEYSEKILKLIQIFQPFELYEFQKKAIIGALLHKHHFIKACTGSGKSAIISVLIKILTSMNLKGLLLVPNISLVNQFNNDLNDYKIDIERRLIGGIYREKKLDKSLTISTWQSASKFKELLKEVDFIIVDEGHTVQGSEVYDIVEKCVNAKYKIGLSGTVPLMPEAEMSLICSFGRPYTYVSARDLINSKLGTEIQINHLKLQYPKEFKEKLKENDNYSKQLKMLLEFKPRTNFLVNLTYSLKGNTVILFDRIAYGLDLFYGILRKKEIQFDSNSAYKDYFLQNYCNVFFVNGLIEGNQREQIRKVMDIKENAIIVANMKILSTGINIRNLHNIIFGTPIKSYITVTQSLGRLIRLHNSKDISNVFDIDDRCGFFEYQYKYRLQNSYNPEKYKIQEEEVKIF